MSFESDVILRNKTVAFIFCILVAFKPFRLDTHCSQFIFTLHYKNREILSKRCVRIIFKCILCCNNTSLIIIATASAVTEVSTEIIIELC